jgi:tyrosyl-tRNA synthetase
MDLTERLDLIIRDPIEEVVTRDELEGLLETVAHPKHYIGFEVSGKLHIGSLILTGFKINDFITAQLDCTVFLADWHTYINNKLGGDWDKIKRISNYYSEAFKFFCPGVHIKVGREFCTF